MKQVSKYYVAEAKEGLLFNAAVVRADNEKILQSIGFFPLVFSNSNTGSPASKLSRIAGAMRLAFAVPKNSLVVFHFPLMATAYRLLQKILKWRKIKTVALVIDIDGVRDKDEKLLQYEVQLLKHFDFIVGHNIAMNNKILEWIPSAKTIPIDLFDYPFAGHIPERTLSKRVCFAGNLSKASFIYHFTAANNVELNVYGEGYDESLSLNKLLQYKGVIAPSLLPAAMEGSFGLVWDGSSTASCDDYLRINNPHKLSLYMAANLPVIVWEQSAAAAFVKRHQVGICIQSLSEIPGRLDALTVDEYRRMTDHVKIIGEAVRSGNFLKAAMEQVRSH